VCFFTGFYKAEAITESSGGGREGKAFAFAARRAFFFRDTVYLAWTRPPHLTSLTRAAVDEYQGSETAGTTKSG